MFNVTRHFLVINAVTAKDLNMLTERSLPQTRNNPSIGSVNAAVQGDQPFQADAQNFAYDYYTTDKKLRLTLSAVQTTVVGNVTIVCGLELAFSADIASGVHTIADKAVFATYWKMWPENGVTRFQTYDADNGSFNLEFDHEQETYVGSFSFTSSGPGTTTLEIREGQFSITGRDNFTL